MSQKWLFNTLSRLTSTPSVIWRHGGLNKGCWRCGSAHTRHHMITYLVCYPRLLQEIQKKRERWGEGKQRSPARFSTCDLQVSIFSLYIFLFKYYAFKGKWKSNWKCSIVTEHTCLLSEVVPSHRNISCDFVAKQMYGFIMDNLNYEPKMIVRHIEQTY